LTKKTLFKTSNENDCFVIDGFGNTTMQCMGGSQVMGTESMHQSGFQKFPVNDPEHRVCVFRNMCIVDGNLTSFLNPHTKANLPEDFLPDGFEGNMYHTAHLRGFTLPIQTVVGSIPSDYSLHHSKLAFLDANSWSYNYGHYMIDNVLTSFTGAEVFNLPFNETQQVFETKCRKFSILEVGFSDKIVDFNHSMGTYQQACRTADGLNGVDFQNVLCNIKLRCDQTYMVNFGPSKTSPWIM
jgi:hypothetical protein